MKITVIGTGYVGLVSGTAFSDLGNDVICADINKEKVSMLNDGKVPFYEPGLPSLVAKNMEAGRLRFTDHISGAIAESRIIFIAVNTPADEAGNADMRQVFSVVDSIAETIKDAPLPSGDFRVIVNKSTSPVGTAKAIRQRLIDGSVPEGDFHVVSNPEFLREGSAIEDFMRPDRVVIGGDNDDAIAVISRLYEPLYLFDSPIIKTNLESAELIKYAANAFLATKISFINDVACLCEKVGADVNVVAKGMGTDGRIGQYFLHPGPGYGGSCFPKDTRALVSLANDVGSAMRIVEAVVEANETHKVRVIERICAHFGDDLSSLHFAVLGLSFKPNTDDVRESPAIAAIQGLLEKGAQVSGFDPVAIPNAKKILGSKIGYGDDPYSLAIGKDALIIMTEWNEFRELDLPRLKEALKAPVLFDMRNVYNPQSVRDKGFTYISVGRS